jgi:AcrR family transcriptional regulator
MQEVIDPRIRRTRLALQQALQKLLKTKRFNTLSVQDIAEEAGVNRVTFYDHYPDRFALLECLVATRFQEHLDRRNIKFDGSCSSALRAIVTAVCDYLVGTRTLKKDRQCEMEPHLETAIVSVVRRLILEGLRQHPLERPASPEMTAATVSWAIYGAVQEWLRTPHRGSPEQTADAILSLVSPILERATV